MALQGDDDFWTPPSESELKILRARRERQDRISRLMGDYLLKGYRMLGDSCDSCGTILLQDKQKKLLCVSCQELDSDTEKDNPVLNHQAALSQVREHQLSLQTCQENPPAQEAQSVSIPKPKADSPPIKSDPILPNTDAIVLAESAVLDKLCWASHQLQTTSSVEFSSQLCALIGSCAQSLRFLRDLNH
ncbi:zinc ribbon domain containing 2 S homeolog [Xenopus laevis]|uniref:Sssca1 protein n=1 Tax=Xenopus laevis TaxID=8355 RepID=Q7ZTP4_XENLA|nr:zinc ribbon domain containing 2 S homeolog [Xenopus laevis]AAH43979.1 Sssca1 protein [Xenopus laevis]